MTIVERAPATTWQTRPGWGIAVDLTPREILVGRQVRVHQRLVAVALVLVLVLCIGLALLTLADRTGAQQDYDREQGRTAQLAAEAVQYEDITVMERLMLQIRTNLATLMSQDVDVADLMSRIRTMLPAGVTVSTESVLFTAAPAAPIAPAGADPSAPGTVAASPASEVMPQVIGSISLAGSGDSISSITRLVSSLSELPGVTDVVPTSVTRGEAGTDYTISLNLTDELYTDRYALAGTP